MSIVLAAATAAPSTVTTIISTIGVMVGAGGIGKLAQMWLQYRQKKNELEAAPAEELKDTLKARVVELEDKVDTLQQRIEEMIKIYTERILFLATENARLHAELEAAHKEIEKLLSDLEETDK